MRIGILGGSFNPVHLGHLILAQYAVEILRLDKLIFVPVNIQPLKSLPLVSGKHRLAMLKIAIGANKKFQACDIEITKKGKSYTADSLSFFKHKFKDKETKLFFITGSDSLKDLARWRDFDKVVRFSTFVVAARPHFALEKRKPYIKYIHIPQIDISSSLIRRRLGGRRSVKYLVEEKVLEYIDKRRLYL